MEYSNNATSSMIIQIINDGISGIKIKPNPGLYDSSRLNSLSCSGRKYILDKLGSEKDAAKAVLAKNGFAICQAPLSDDFNEVPSGGKSLELMAWEGILHDGSSKPPTVVWKEYAVKSVSEKNGDTCENSYLSELVLDFHGLNGERAKLLKDLEDSVVKAGSHPLFTVVAYR